MMRFLPFLAVFLISGTTLAQPEFFGCHHFRNLMPKHKTLTDAERAMIDASILRSDTFDILHYDIRLDVTDETSHIIDGWTTIHYTPKMPDLETITLDLYELNIDSIVDESGPLSFNYDDECMVIHFNEIPAVSDTLELTVYYNGTPHQDPYWGGFYFEGGYVYNLGIGLTSIPPNFGKVWYPCFDTFVERATYEYHITSANGHKADCQGDLIEEIQLDGDTVTRHFLLNQQIPTYLSAIAVSNYDTYEYTHEGAYGDIPVTLKAKPSQLAAMQSAFQELSYAIDALEYWYGPYAWSRVGYVLTTDGALEIPTNIAYPQSMTGASLSANGALFSHELGHCWWGDIVTLSEHNHMWIKEGPAEYSGHLFVEWKDGEEEFIEEVKDNMHFVLSQAHIDDDGFHPLSPMPDPHIYGRHTYYKGAAVMHNMRGYMGEELWREAMMGVQENYAYTSFYPEEFKEALEAESGYDLDPFFNDWIYAPGFSVFVADSALTSGSDGNYSTTVYLHQKLREAPNFHQEVPLNVSFVDEDWQRHDFPVVASGEFTTVTIDTDFEPMMTITNGGYKLNQARLDYTVTLYPDESFNQQLPFVDMRLIKNDVPDSTYVRIEHVWAQPEDNPGEGVWDIGDRHYWRVDGIFPATHDLEARLMYDGTDEYDLDYDLVNETEEDFVLIYRPDPSQPWEVYWDYTLVAGSLTSATGTVKVDKLIPGEYAFANGDESVGIKDNTIENQDSGFVAYPNPARQEINLSGYSSESHQAMVVLYDELGREVDRGAQVTIHHEYQIQHDVSQLPAGWYLIVLQGNDGMIIDQTSIEVMK